MDRYEVIIRQVGEKDGGIIIQTSEVQFSLAREIKKEVDPDTGEISLRPGPTSFSVTGKAATPASDPG